MKEVKRKERTAKANKRKMESLDMLNELRVFYEAERKGFGLMTFNNRLVVFQDQKYANDAKIGLGVIEEGTLCNSEHCGFAHLVNVPTIMPEDYKDIRFFKNRGVPVKVEKGVYGANVLFRETYRGNVFIRAYKTDGSIGLYEREKMNTIQYVGDNIFYTRLNNVIENWEDVTQEVHEGVIEKVTELKCDLPYTDKEVYESLSRLTERHIYLLDTGVYLAEGDEETLVLWSDKEGLHICWLGCIYPIERLKDERYKEITEEIIALGKAQIQNK